MSGKRSEPYTLGLDLGDQSLGWVVLDVDEDENAYRIRDMGVRCFDTSVTNAQDIEAGKDKTRNAERRKYRHQRRQIRRRAGRRKLLFRVLQDAGLLPKGAARTPQERHELLLSLDKELASKHLEEHNRVASHVLMYQLRAKALDEPLSPHELGRVLYHLAQRRGFLSNKRIYRQEDEDEEKGKVRPAITKLEEAIRQAGKRTLGEYLAALDPEEAGQRIRGLATGRAMFKNEFEEICRSQAKYHPILTELRKRVYHILFHQRPVKSQKNLIGKCKLERGRRRAPMALLESQRFRYLQKVNNLRVIHPVRQDPSLTEDERTKLIEALELEGDLSFARVRELLDLRRRPEGRAYKLNLEIEGEEELIGNRTNARILQAVGDAWSAMPEDARRRLVRELLSFERPDALARRLHKEWGLKEDTAANLSEVRLEPGYCSFSRQAIAKLLPKLEVGVSLSTALKDVYGEEPTSVQVHNTLPPVLRALPELRNPIVCRGLSELRKVVNALIRRHGKPAFIRLELARNLKRGKRIRERTKQRNDQNRDQRTAAARRIREKMPELRGGQPSDTDILKVQLADECKWTCPYSGEQIEMRTLLGEQPRFEIEHIIPISRSLDSSFANKTLCYQKENARKARRTPFEAYSSLPDEWRDILYRVRHFQGRFQHEKLRRFQLKKIPDDFGARQLNDSAYMSRLASEYLALLYGGAVDAGHTRRVFVVPGKATFHLRREWGLDGILNNPAIRDAIPNGKKGKNRHDHRHHAVDALVVGLTSQRVINMLCKAAERAEDLGHRLFFRVDEPWKEGFLADAFKAVSNINVSRRIDRRISGALHKDTIYTRLRKSTDKRGRKIASRHVRVPLEDITTQKKIDNIVDHEIRKLVQKAFEENRGKAGKPFAEEKQRPYLQGGDGRIIPIRKVRIRRKASTHSLGAKPHAKEVVLGASNHHMEIIAVRDDDGRHTRWEGALVTLLKAVERAHPPRNQDKQPVVQREHGHDKEFQFSLAKGEYVKMEYEPGQEALYRVTGISEGEIGFHLQTDARPTKMKGRKRVRCSPDSLRKAKARKVAVDPLGNVFPAND